jgi:hypothetical protein
MFWRCALFVGLLLAPSQITRDTNPLKGSVESLRYQNERIDALGIPRVKTEKDIENLWWENKVSRVIDFGDGYYIEKSVNPKTRFLRPEAKRYLECFAEEYWRTFQKQLKVTSLCRTVSQQKQLRKSGASFADAGAGETQSTHLACTTFDVSINGMSQKEISFISERLIEDRADGKVDAFLEILSRHFHIVVFRN